jgi:hypothetical protein
MAAGLAEAVARQYVSWMREYVLFHNKRHPQEMGVPEVRAFLADSRFSGQAGERVEAGAAIRFLYEVVLQRHWPRGALDGTGESGGNGSGGKPKAVYLNGCQQGVKLLDRVRDALRVGQYALETEKTLTRKEVPGVLQRVAGGGGLHKLMAELMYGSGLRVKECCRLRVKDIHTTMIYLHVMEGGTTDVRSPLDLLEDK